MDQRILLISISSAFLLWFLWHFGRALWIVWINARVRRHGVPIKGRVVSATDKTYKTRDGAIFFFRVTYTYIYEGLRFYAEQDVSEDAPIPIFHYDRVLESSEECSLPIGQ